VTEKLREAVAIVGASLFQQPSGRNAASKKGKIPGRTWSENRLSTGSGDVSSAERDRERQERKKGEAAKDMKSAGLSWGHPRKSVPLQARADPTTAPGSLERRQGPGRRSSGGFVRPECAPLAFWCSEGGISLTQKRPISNRSCRNNMFHTSGDRRQKIPFTHRNGGRKCSNTGSKVQKGRTQTCPRKAGGAKKPKTSSRRRKSFGVPDPL